LIRYNFWFVIKMFNSIIECQLNASVCGYSCDNRPFLLYCYSITPLLKSFCAFTYALIPSLIFLCQISCTYPCSICILQCSCLISNYIYLSINARLSPVCPDPLLNPIKLPIPLFPCPLSPISHYGSPLKASAVPYSAWAPGPQKQTASRLLWCPASHLLPIYVLSDCFFYLYIGYWKYIFTYLLTYLHIKSIQKSSAVCRIARDHGTELCRTARDHDPALCLHTPGPHIFVYISANSQQNSKIFYSMNQGLDGIVWWKKPEVKNLVTLSL
jgi:hypothetical protein